MSHLTLPIIRFIPAFSDRHAYQDRDDAMHRDYYHVANHASKRQRQDSRERSRDVRHRRSEYQWHDRVSRYTNASNDKRINGNRKLNAGHSKNHDDERHQSSSTRKSHRERESGNERRERRVNGDLRKPHYFTQRGHRTPARYQHQEKTSEKFVMEE